MIYTHNYRFVNDCVKIDIIPLNTKKLYRDLYAELCPPLFSPDSLHCLL